MTDRRFNEEEVAAIFERASVAQPADSRTPSDANGMTLAQLQEIGSEVGIAPDAIARAAMSIDQRGTATSRKFLGLPIGVGRTVDLPRKLSDDEWERLVVDLRETFDARGVMRSEGSLRQWTNGNLQVLLEPTAAGHRIRFRTIKGNVRNAMAMGAMIIGVAIVGLITTFLKKGGFDTGIAMSMASFAAVGAGAIAVAAAQLPGWAKTRRQQMQNVAARLTASISD